MAKTDNTNVNNTNVTATLKRQLEEHKQNIDDVQRKKRIKSETDAFRRSAENSFMEDMQKLKKKVEEYYRKVEEQKKNPRSNQQYHVGSIASWMMEGADRFENIVKFLVNKGISLRTEYVTGPFAMMFKEKFKELSLHLYEYAFGEENNEQIDLEYGVSVNEQGELSCAWSDSLSSLLEEANDSQQGMSEKLGLMQALLQESMSEWLDSIDGLDATSADSKKGYFISLVGGKNKIYPKSSATQNADGAWVVNEGSQNDFVNQNKLVEILSGFGHAKHSFAAYLQSACPANFTIQHNEDLDLTAQQSISAPRPRF